MRKFYLNGAKLRVYFDKSINSVRFYGVRHVMKNDIVMIIFKNGAEFRCVEFCPVGSIVSTMLYYFVSTML